MAGFLSNLRDQKHLHLQGVGIRIDHHSRDAMTRSRLNSSEESGDHGVLPDAAVLLSLPFYGNSVNIETVQYSLNPLNLLVRPISGLIGETDLP